MNTHAAWASAGAPAWASSGAALGAERACSERCVCNNG
ncbi:hypothetical protein LMG29542_00386 [Paraburkholderia humisilvae]|uniref:Uncharacterized protein n=1 Tax=Paraburkholderia humisilvae TaxID=627669 RepID=A0A6J5D1H4_9BURK|nr:hypothetical protein LMG29542_00386 [Paraburkholderia humisilvae]